MSSGHIEDLVARNRSFRRFAEHEPVPEALLRELIGLARLSATGSNVQPLKFMLSCEPDRNALIFPHLAWAGHLKDWPGPAEGERPGAYVIILGDKDVSASFGVDHGIAAQSILLGAAERGLGGCMIGSIQRPALRKALAIPERYEILLVIALGTPAERVVIDTVGKSGDTRYWRDENDVHHVPKRPLDDLILG
jgi:nitroreductase